MNERSVLIVAGLLGAAAGIAAGFVLFTDSGRRWRVDAERNLSDFLQEAERLLSAADQVRQSVAELRGGKQTAWPRSA